MADPPVPFTEDAVERTRQSTNHRQLPDIWKLPGLELARERALTMRAWGLGSQATCRDLLGARDPAGRDMGCGHLRCDLESLVAWKFQRYLSLVRACR
jgi:hypothetical protein